MNKDIDIQTLIKELESIRDPICDFLKNHRKNAHFSQVIIGLAFTSDAICDVITDLLGQEKKKSIWRGRK